MGNQGAGRLDKDRVAVEIMYSSGWEKWKKELRIFVNPASLLKNRLVGLVNISAI